MTNASSGSDYDWHSDLRCNPPGARKACPRRVFFASRRNWTMKRCIFAVVLLFTLAAAGQTPTRSGWTPLFSGKDLSGWKKNGDEKWVADQGTILCESTANKYGYLTTEKTYGNFDLRLKFKGEAE